MQSRSKAPVQFDGIAGLQQRVIPQYRAPLFEKLAAACSGGLEICAGVPDPEEGIVITERLHGPRLTPVENITFSSGRTIAYWQKGARKWARSVEADAVILEGNPRLISNSFVRRIAQARHIPVIGWGGAFLSYPRSAQAAWFSRWLSRFDAMIVYGTKARDDHVRFGVDPAKIFVAPNSVETQLADEIWARMKANPGLRAEWRQMLGFDDRPVILSVGRILARKRLDVLVHAVARLTERPQLVIVGDGPDLQATKELAARAGVEARFPGHLKGEALAHYFVAADLFVLPGLGGLAMQEALAYGKPLISAQADGTEIDLTRPENGRRVPPGDVPALAREMSDLLADPERLARMGRESRRIVEEEWNINEAVAGCTRALRFATGR